MDPRTEALHRWQKLDADRLASTSDEKLAAAYSAGLASSLLRDWARADAAFANALTAARASPQDSARAQRAIALTQAESLLARGAPDRAAAVLLPYARDNSRPVLLLTAQVALASPAGSAPVAPPAGAASASSATTAVADATGKPALPTAADPARPASAALADSATKSGAPAVTTEPSLTQSAEDLQTWVALHPTDSNAWSALGQVWGRLGQPLRALRAEAEARVALGDLVGAIDRLRAAQQVARGAQSDFIDASVIDARMRDIEAQRKLQLADEKALR